MTMADDATYIQVTGEASYAEMAREYVADLQLGAKASRHQRAAQSIAQLHQLCLATLLEAGLDRSQIADGPTEVGHEYSKKMIGSHHLTITVGDPGLLTAALAALEPLFDQKKWTLQVQMRQPIFQSAPEVRAQAIRAALADARSKAAVLAAEAPVALGAVVRIEEGAKALRASGAAGDEDYFGDRTRYAASIGSLGDSGPFDAMPAPGRTIWVRYTVRFSIAPQG
ncbi:MAG: SIMPL domain-containing protein [Planctomycetaceae bacterium]|nr:SIMPL domain-containing protein [Planctomycetaceae bacterium]